MKMKKISVQAADKVKSCKKWQKMCIITAAVDAKMMKTKKRCNTGKIWFQTKIQYRKIISAMSTRQSNYQYPSSMYTKFESQEKSQEEFQLFGHAWFGQPARIVLLLEDDGKKVDQAKYENEHSSKSIKVIKLTFRQNDPHMK